MSPGRLKSTCVSAQSDPSLCCPTVETWHYSLPRICPVKSKDSDQSVQADQNVSQAHISEGMFSNVAFHFIYFNSSPNIKYCL